MAKRIAKARRERQPRQERRLDAKTMKLWRGLLFALLIVVSWAIMSIGFLPAQVALTEGEIAQDDYFYDGATVTYVSDILTEEARNDAAAAVEEQYIVDDTALANLLEEIDGYFTVISRAANGELAVSEIRAALPGEYTDAALYAMASLSQDNIEATRDAFKRMVEGVFAGGVLENDIEDARQSIALAISASTISGNVELFLKSLNEGIAYPFNKVFDAVATAEMTEEARDEVEPVSVTVLKGEKLVSRGQVVTAEQVEALQALRLQSDSRILTPHIGLFILVALCYLILYFYLKFYEKSIFNRRPAILLLGVVMVVILLLCKLISLISFDMEADLMAQIGYLLPVTAASMVLTVLLDREVAAMCTVILAGFVGIIMDGSMAFPLMALAGGLTGIITASRLNQRSQFVGASAYIILANLLVVGSWGLIWHQSYAAIGVGMLFAVINGILSAILAMGILPYLESAFGITTVIRLLELSNSNHPLLKRLMMEAPGTYNHSILVGNLAEAAADAIGANTLLVRVASYYNYIGHVYRPHFYIENQRPGENPHDKLQPALSAMIITSHTTDGAKMLREEHFPEEIIDIVEQHHGNSVLKYFYNKAKEQAADPEEVKMADYRYKGRRPQTKEAALVMLADSVQAAVQAINNQDNEQVKEKVYQVINAKMQEGQLADCPLTFKDLEVISQSFLMVLSGMNHQRINYPDSASGALIEGASNEHEAEHK